MIAFVHVTSRIGKRLATSYSDRLLHDAPVEELPRCNADTRPADTYIPYAIDWRFLPEPALLVKDAARHALAAASNAAALAPPTRGFWASTLGRRTFNAVTRAGRIFIHIPKTAGTSVCAGLYGRNLPHYTRSFYTAAYGSRIAALPSFSIVRDPVDRLHSAYRLSVPAASAA